MAKQNEDYSWIGWVVAAAIAAIFIFYLVNSNKDTNSSGSSRESSSTLADPSTEETTNEADTVKSASDWQCYDATSYNQNAYDDNRCTNGSETRYVSDSQAIELDPNYSPGKSGASYYNNQ